VIFGTAIVGNLAVGRESAGSETTAAGGERIALTVATATFEYGSASAIKPTTPNQKRWRRVPRLPRTNVPEPPYPPATAEAGVRKPLTQRCP
jgi:hypothetical protein